MLATNLMEDKQMARVNSDKDMEKREEKDEDIEEAANWEKWLEIDQSLGKLDELRERASGGFPVTIEVDSTGGRPELQPLCATPWRKALVVVGSLLGTVLLVLIVHFNIGTIWAVLLAIAALFVLAVIRTLPAAPMEISVELRDTGSLQIKSGSDWAYPIDVGPIWEQDGVLFALIHNYTKENASQDGGLGLLHHLHQRACKLGESHWQPSVLDCPDKVLFPGIGQTDDAMDKGLREMFGGFFLGYPSIEDLKPILLGRPKNRDNEGFKEEYDLLIGMFNTIAFTSLQAGKILDENPDVY